jgi:hypothetical protein
MTGAKALTKRDFTSFNMGGEVPPQNCIAFDRSAESTLIASTGQGCTNIMPPGLPLGSKEITNLEYHPGSCEPSGGETIGDIDPLGPPTVYCCIVAVSRQP